MKNYTYAQRLSVITDEISQDFEYALSVAKEFGVKDVEIRGIWKKNIAMVSNEDIDRIIGILQKFDMGVSVICSPFGKCPLPSHSKQNKPTSYSRNTEYNLSLFDRIVEISDRLGTNKIRIFNFFKPGLRPVTPEHIKEAADALLPYIKKAELLGKILVLENEHVCLADNIKNTLDFLEVLNSPSLKLNLDPGNFYSVKERTDAEAYSIFYKKDLVSHFHVKDPKQRIPILGAKFQVVGEGKISYPPLLKQAKNHGYEGYYALETHALFHKELISKKSLKNLKQMLEQLEN